MIKTLLENLFYGSLALGLSASWGEMTFHQGLNLYNNIQRVSFQRDLKVFLENYDEIISELIIRKYESEGCLEINDFPYIKIEKMPIGEGHYAEPAKRRIISCSLEKQITEV